MKMGRAENGRTLRAAIVGAGLMGRWHADSAAHAGAVVSVVVDPTLRRARQLGREYRAKITGSLAEIADFELPDIIHICTPVATHESIALEAVRRRRHVIVEKPLAQNAEGAALLLRCSQAQGVLLCPTHQCIFQHGIQELLKTDLGKIRHLEATICSAGARSCSDADRINLVREILPHPLSLFGRFTGMRLAELEWEVITPVPGEMRAMTEAGDLTLSLLISSQGRPTTNTLRLVGEKGSAHADLFHGFAFVERGSASRIRKISRPFLSSAKQLLQAGSNLMGRAMDREYAYPGLRNLICAFYGAVQNGRPAPLDTGEILDVAATCDLLTEKAVGRDFIHKRQSSRARLGVNHDA